MAEPATGVEVPDLKLPPTLNFRIQSKGWRKISEPGLKTTWSVKGGLEACRGVLPRVNTGEKRSR